MKMKTPLNQKEAYVSTTAGTPTLSFILFSLLFPSSLSLSLSLSLSPLSVSPCTEEDRIKNHKWVFKVVPDDPKLRTFYITTAARHEMEVSENVNVVTCFFTIKQAVIYC